MFFGLFDDPPSREETNKKKWQAMYETNDDKDLLTGISRFLIPCNIDVDRFILNGNLLSQMVSSHQMYHDQRMSSSLYWLLTQPEFGLVSELFPTWFVFGFPDVVRWLIKNDSQNLSKYSLLNEEEIYAPDGSIAYEHLKSMLAIYLNEGNHLELMLASSASRM
jgi:hypothetical protein